MKPNDQLDDLDDDEDDDTYDEELEDRTKDYSGLKYVQKQLGDLYSIVEAAFADKSEQNNIISECWDTYHCELNEHQTYVGNANAYVPIIRDAMAARETRFINMLFPQSGRFTDIVGHDGKIPYDLIALMDDYVRRAKLREKMAPALIRTGDISGNYDLYIDWVEHTRHVTSKVKEAETKTELGTPVEGSKEYDDIECEEVTDSRPDVSVLDPRNLVIWPASCTTVEEAEAEGGVAILMHFSKGKIKRWIKKGIFDKKAGEKLLGSMSSKVSNPLPNTPKDASNAAGVRADSKGNKTAMVFQVWSRLKIRGETRLMVTHFAGEDQILACKRCPYWCDKIPVIHQQVEPNPDSIWGPSQVYPIVSLQYQANDVVNEGFDSAQYALMPIVMTDPEKNPRAGSMVLAMASVWLTDPNSTKFAEFPALWKDAFSLVGACKEQIFQSLGVNPAMIPQGNASKKPTQAQVAQEQQVALESSADNVALIQEGVLSEVVRWFYELDYQYRTEAVTVKKYGEFGLQATMDQVEPFQVRERYEFRWYGTEGFKAQQQVQSMISFAGVLQKMPPQQLNGRKLDMGPVIDYISGVVFGPRLAPFVLVDQRHQLTMSPKMENKLLANSFPVQVHEMDNDQEHIMDHMMEFEALLQQPPELLEQNTVARLAKGHILEHIKSAKMKAQAAMGGQLGQVGGGGGPRPGAQVQAPTGPQQPPGAVRPDQMSLAAPRKSAM